MRLVTFHPAAPSSGYRAGGDSDAPGASRLGALVEGNRVLDLRAAAARDGRADPALVASMQAWLDGGESSVALARRLVESPQECDWVPLESVRLDAPLPRPRSIRDCLSYRRHWEQSARTIVSWRKPLLVRFDRWLSRYRGGRSLLGPPPVWFRHPLYYKGNPHSVVGPDAPVRRPRACHRFDFELELALVIGKPGRDIAEADALGHVAGYLIFNDFSARDLQAAEMSGRLGPAKAKDFDTGNVIGPWLTTPDELTTPPESGWSATAKVNGVTWSNTSTANPQFGVAATIAYLSRDETLRPGDLIGLGTLPDGCGLEQQRFLTDGDVVELAIAGLGTLRNQVVAPD